MMTASDATISLHPAKHHKLLEVPSILPSPNPLVDQTDWCGLYSIDSLKLTLEDIISECAVPHKDVLEEYPFFYQDRDWGTTAPLSPSRPHVHVDQDKLTHRNPQLEALISLYENRLQWLSMGSRLYCGQLSGSKITLLVETSDKLCSEASRFGEYLTAIQLLMHEQLVEKDTVQLMEFGSSASPTDPPPLPFAANTEGCCRLASDWLASLEGSGSCNLLVALKAALELRNVDTICVLLSSKPDQDLGVVSDYIADRLSGYEKPKLHLVAFNSSNETAVFLSQLAEQTGGHYHKFISSMLDNQKALSFEDSEIGRIREEVNRAQSVLCELKKMKHGMPLSEDVLQTLRELSVGSDFPEVPPLPPQVEEHCILNHSEQWLKLYGVAAQGLNLYHFLAPNAYPQLEDFVDIIERRVVSQVYDVMPLFPWYDGTFKYLYVDVPLIEQYQHQLEEFIEEKLQKRISWLLSGTRVPFGVISEQRVLLVLDSSYLMLPQVLGLQHHLKLLLEEQLAHVKAFDLVRFGRECCAWRGELAELDEYSLQEAWEWVLGVSPAGTCNVLEALRLIFESGDHFDTKEEVGIYLVVSSMPDQEVTSLCSYVEQQLSGRAAVKLHTVFYNTEPLMRGMVVPGQLGGRYGSEGEIAMCLEQMAESGGGCFHHFRVSGSVEGTDITAMLDELAEAQFYQQTARDIVGKYKEFCKRNVPPPIEELIPVLTQPPPIHPRQTTASLARMNASAQKLSSVSAAETANQAPKKYIKSTFFYLDEGLHKGRAWDILDHLPPSKRRAKPLIPNKEEYISSKEWLLKYGVERLGLSFERLVVDGSRKDSCQDRTVYKHITQKGEVVDLYVSHQGLKNYRKRLLTAVDRYKSRLEWLLSDDHKHFGTIIERKVVFLLDMSSSMSGNFPEVRDSLMHLLQHKPPRLKSFNIIAYASSVTMWQDSLVAATESNCSEAMHWLQSLRPGGCSCMLEALKVSLQSGALGIYLITDGTSDHTQEFLLNQLSHLRVTFGDAWRINTVAFHCTEEVSYNFLHNLAIKSDGRYHNYPLSTEFSEGDVAPLLADQNVATDLKLVVGELLLANSCLMKTKNFL